MEEKKVVDGLEDDAMSFVGDVFDGSVSDHSQADTPETVASPAVSDETGDDAIPDDAPGFDEEPVESDSVAETKVQDEQEKAFDADSALREELESLKKRFHDTQAAFHAERAKSAELEKRLETAEKAPGKAEDDWFGEEDDKNSSSEAEKPLHTEEDKRLSELDAEIKRIEQAQANAIWEAAAAKVKAEHDDFEKVVYDGLCPLLEEDGTGDSYIRELWSKERDHSPANAYKFGKRALEIKEFQRDPDAFKRKISSESESNASEVPTGKAGLDMLPSVTAPSRVRERDGDSFVDAVFG